MNHFGAASLIFGLLLWSIVVKIVIKRLPDVHYIYSSICFGSEGFDFVVCDFRSGCLFFHRLNEGVDVWTVSLMCQLILLCFFEQSWTKFGLEEYVMFAIVTPTALLVRKVSILMYVTSVSRKKRLSKRRWLVNSFSLLFKASWGKSLLKDVS